MLKLRAFRPTSEKIVKIQLHPTHPWLVTADSSDNVVVWDWEHRQVMYELKAGGVDQRRLVGAKLEKLAEGEAEPKSKPTEAMRGGSVKQVAFYDDDVRYWQAWLHRAAASEAPVAVNQQFAHYGGALASTRGRHFLVICCENKAIFLDMVTMRGRDVPKQDLDNRSLLCMEFLSRFPSGDGPLVAFGGSDGVIRVLSMATWKPVRKYTGGHKGAVSCLMTFLASSGETLLVSGASDGLLVLWSADHVQDSREIAPKLSLKAHDGGVLAIELLRVSGSAPELITIGADKTLAIWDTVSFKEVKRIKPVAKLTPHSVASWCHPRAPNLDILTCVKDSHIWAIEHPTFAATTRPLCDLSSQVPISLLAPNKKLKAYCMVVHPLQPHLVATGTSLGVILSEFDTRSLPAAAPLPTPSGSREHSVVFMAEREIKLLNFQLSNPVNPSLASSNSVSEAGRLKTDSSEALQVKQLKRRVGPVTHDAYSCVSVSSSGKYVSVVWPDIPFFSVYRVSNWAVIHSGTGRLFAWDTCRDRYALLETAATPRMPIIPKGGSSKKAREAAAAAAQAAAAAASLASAATVQVHILLDDGSSNLLARSIEGRSDPVIGLHSGALLGVAYKTARRISPNAATAISTLQSGALSGIAPNAGGMLSSFSAADDGAFMAGRSPIGEAPANFQLYSWETFKPVSGLLPQPEWTAWDQTVEYCAFAYQHYIVLASLRPQFRYLGDVAIVASTGGVWHRRQLFVATPTTIECVFVDAGVSPIDLETKKKKEEMKAKETQARAVAEHGELALITVDSAQTVVEERVPLRSPMLQVVRLASFQHSPSVPPFMSVPKQSKVDGEENIMPKEMEERRVNEVAVAGGGVSVAVTRFPQEQKRPVGPLVVVGVRDGVLWLVDRYMSGHAIALSHPGIRCRCLAAYGDAVSAVKWSTRLGREHHDDLAQFMLGMGYATEALHLPGISKRLEFDLAMQSNDLKRALQCLLTMSNSRSIGQDVNVNRDATGILSLAAKQEFVADAVQGIVKFAKEFLDLIDAADATAQADIASEALKRLAAAGSVKGALQLHELRGLALRLANHGELTRLSVLVNNMITAGEGREAAFSAAVLGDNVLMEKAWQETGMYAEAVLHAHAHGRPSLKNLLELWNKSLQKGIEHTTTKSRLTDSASVDLAGLEREPTLQSLNEVKRHPLIQIVPPGMMASSVNIPSNPKPIAMVQNGQQASKPLLLEAAPTTPAVSVSTPLSATPPVSMAPTTSANPPVSMAPIASANPVVSMAPTAIANPPVSIAPTASANPPVSLTPPESSTSSVVADLLSQLSV